MMNKEKDVVLIAGKGHETYQLVAGRKKHFDDYWARDCFFGCLGALKLKDYLIVKKSLELFLKYQKNDGNEIGNAGNAKG